MQGRFPEPLKKEFEYYPLPNGMADVFIFNLDSKKVVTNEYDGKTFTEYEYEMNEFTVDQSVVSFDDVASDPMQYLDYEVALPVSQVEKVQAQAYYTAMMTDTILED